MAPKIRKKTGGQKLKTILNNFVITIAKENPSWGYDRIAGAVANLGYTISNTTIANILKRNGVGPAKDRKRNTTWNQFIKHHKDILWATDFFSSEIWCKEGDIVKYERIGAMLNYYHRKSA